MFTYFCCALIGLGIVIVSGCVWTIVYFVNIMIEHEK